MKSNLALRLVRLIIPSLFSVTLSLQFLGCSSAEKNADTPEGIFAIGKEYEKDERYEEAIRKYNDIRTRFPYSSVATEAELAVADSNFKQESYAEAQLGYQSFREQRPRHPKIAYVIYQLGLSYFNQLPETVDRDLSLADEAIEAFDTLIRSYPQVEYVADAKEKRRKIYELLAGREQYIADFYLKKEKFGSALGRYEGLLKTYPGMGFDEKALVGAAIASYKAGEHQKAKGFYDKLKSSFPDSSDLSKVKSELGL